MSVQSDGKYRYEGDAWGGYYTGPGLEGAAAFECVAYEEPSLDEVLRALNVVYAAGFAAGLATAAHPPNRFALVDK